MSYDIELSSEALTVLKGLAPALRGEVVRQLRRLAQSPVTLSRPSATPPYPPGYQVFESWLSGSDPAWRLAVLFKYAADETTLHVYRIGVLPYKGRP